MTAVEPLTPQGRALRLIAETGNAAVDPFGFVPCAREHTPGYLCILPDGHSPSASVDWMAVWRA